MKRNPYTISVPKPCHENWEQMTAADNGRFCGSCQHTVVDFTTLTDQQVLEILKNGQFSCGRFLDTQLQRPFIDEPKRQVFFSSGVIKKIAASLLFFQTIAHTSWAQAPAGYIRGQVLDNKKEPIVNAVIQVRSAQKIYGGAVTDIDGNYDIEPLPTGIYEISIKSVGYKDSILKKVTVEPAQPTVINANLTQVDMPAIAPKVIRMGYSFPLVDKYDPAPKAINNGSSDKEEIIKMGGPAYMDDIPALQPGVYKRTFWQRINIFRRRKQE